MGRWRPFHLAKVEQAKWRDVVVLKLAQPSFVAPRPCPRQFAPQPHNAVTSLNHDVYQAYVSVGRSLG